MNPGAVAGGRRFSVVADGHVDQQENVSHARDPPPDSVAVGGLKAVSCHGTPQSIAPRGLYSLSFAYIAYRLATLPLFTSPRWTSTPTRRVRLWPFLRTYFLLPLRASIRRGPKQP